jgi:hypothetical protein
LEINIDTEINIGDRVIYKGYGGSTSNVIVVGLKIIYGVERYSPNVEYKIVTDVATIYVDRSRLLTKRKPNE